MLISTTVNEVLQLAGLTRARIEMGLCGVNALPVGVYVGAAGRCYLYTVPVVIEALEWLVKHNHAPADTAARYKAIVGSAV